MGLYVRGNRYYFKKQLEGKVYYKALKIKKGQEKLLSTRIEQVEEEIIAEHFGIPYKPKNQIKFIDYCEMYIESKKDKKSIELDIQRLKIMAKILNDPVISTISKKQIDRLDKALSSRGIKKSTVNRYFEVLRCMFNLACEDGYLKENPVKHYIPYTEDGERRALTQDELSRILKASAEVQADPRSKLQSIINDIIVLAVNTGMRLSEILNVRKSYVRDDIIFYPITKTKHKRRVTSQNKRAKVICLNGIASAIIKKQKSTDEFVFPMEWRDPKAIRRTTNRIREISGVSDFTFHQLRHTVSTFLSSQVSLTTAMVLLGHSSLSTTLRYTHPEIQEQRRGVAKLEQYFQELTDK